MERRNLYRILHVQPEAPPEVIKAAYRALMSTLRMHPDLGGDTEAAARLNAAYATLSDPASRRAYDLSLRRAPRGSTSSHATAAAGTAAATRAATAAASSGPPSFSPATWLADRRCPLCSKHFTARPAANARCTNCDAPLTLAPAETEAGVGQAELIGRRRSGRVARPMAGWMRLPGQPGEIAVQLRDLSLAGLSLTCPQALAQGTSFRIVTSLFDAVALVVGSQPRARPPVLHARLLTLQLLRQAPGAFVSVKA